MTKSGNTIQENSNGFKLVAIESIESDGRRNIVYVILDPMGKEIGRFSSLSEALVEFEELTDEPDFPSGPSFG